MDGHQDISEQSSEHALSAIERSLQAKIVRLENQLQGYKSQIDILDDQRQKLEERALGMESALMKTKKDLLEAKREALDKDLKEMKMSEKLNAMTIQAEKYKRLFMAESTKNRCGIEKLEKLISNVKARMAPVARLNQFEDFKELVTVIQEGFQTQIMMVLEKLHEAENKPSPKPGFQLNQGKKANGKALFTLGRPSSGPCAGLNFESVKLPFDAKLPFGSAAEGEDGGKSIFPFNASVKQTPKSSFGTAFQISENTGQVKPAFVFGSLDQKPKSNSGAALLGNEKAAETKPAFIFGSLDQKSKSNYRAALLGNEIEVETMPVSVFGSLDQKPKSNSGAALLGNEKTAETKPVSTFGSLNHKPKSSSGATLHGNEKAAETKPVFVFRSRDEKMGGKPSFAFGTVATSSGTGFTFGSTVPSSGTEFSFGSAGTSEGAAKPCFTFSSSNQTSNTSSGAALTFDSLKQGRNVTRELQAEEHKKDDSRSDKQTLKDVEQLGDKEDNIALGSVATRHSGKELLEKFKAEEGSWKCGICMVRNSNDKVKCVACSSPKPGVEVSQDKKTQGKPLLAFGSGATSSGTGIMFGSTVPSSGTGGSIRSGSSFHTEEVEEDLFAKFKAEEAGSWECGICMVKNSSDKLECTACASPKPGVEISQDKNMGGKPLFAFGSGATFSGTGLTFGSTVPSSGTGVSFRSGSTAHADEVEEDLFAKKNDEEVEQLQKEEENDGITTVEAQAEKSKKEETAPAGER